MMVKNSIVAFCCFISLFSFSQQNEYEKYPVFPECENTDVNQLPDCFHQTLQQFIVQNFQLPEVVNQESYRGQLVVLFEVNREGQFVILYIDAVYQELKDEMQRIFDLLPTIVPPTYNSRPTYMQFTMPLKIPLEAGSLNTELHPINTENSLVKDTSNQYSAIQNLGYTNQKYSSHINIPLSVQEYNRIGIGLNQVGNNTHSAQKPYLYSDVTPYYHMQQRDTLLYKNKSSWLGRKWWNEHMVAFRGENYWFTIDPGVDLQLGKDFDNEEHDYTYNNTRLVTVQGGLGKRLNFHAVVYESQGRFAEYYNQYAESIAPDGGNPAIIPGFGIAKEFKETAYDYPLATGYLSYSTGDGFFNFQAGHGKNFLGDGYRSLFLSDIASPAPFFKINTTFWKLKYTNLWMSLRDVRSEVTQEGTFATKYMAIHYLSYNITRRLNIGLFESVLWHNSNDRGFDVNYLNPIIFYRAIEFSTGSRAGNALLGLSAKYKVSDQVSLYGQWIIDEFSSGDIFGGEKSWKNKLGYQLGAKYFNAFGVENLFLRAEYNRVRPYTYSHNTGILNYGHNNQSMAHPWGANFNEIVLISSYEKGRWFGNLKLIYGERGEDYLDGTDDFNYGGNIYRSEIDRPYETGHTVAQGNTASVFFGEMQGGYLINPSTNLKVYASLIYRNINPQQDIGSVSKNQTTWLNLGIRTDLFNWYFDY